MIPKILAKGNSWHFCKIYVTRLVAHANKG